MTEKGSRAPSLSIATLLAVTGLAACATVKTDDLRVVSLRKISGSSIPVAGVIRDRLMDDAFLEATLSTAFDVAASARGREPWAPYAREWICDRGQDDNFPLAVQHLFEDGRPVRPRASTASSERGTAGVRIYTIYFPVRARAQQIDALSPKKTAYDLEKAPADVCVELGTAGYFTVSLKTNVVTIPAQEFEALFNTKGDEP